MCQSHLIRNVQAHMFLFPGAATEWSRKTYVHTCGKNVDIDAAHARPRVSASHPIVTLQEMPINVQALWHPSLWHPSFEGDPTPFTIFPCFCCVLLIHIINLMQRRWCFGWWSPLGVLWRVRYPPRRECWPFLRYSWHIPRRDWLVRCLTGE